MPGTRPTRSTFDTLLAFFVAAAGALICRLAAGPSLGLFIGGVLLAGILVPPLAVMRDEGKSRFFAVAAAIDGIGLVWLTAALQSQVRFFDWIWCFLVLAAFAFAVAGVAWIGTSAGFHSIVASAIAMVVASAWLAWPIWYSPYPAGSGMADAAIRVHPLFAINGVLPQLGIWTEHALAYRLTNLGQDVPYLLPPPYYSIVTHATIASLLIAATYSISSRKTSDVSVAPPV